MKRVLLQPLSISLALLRPHPFRVVPSLQASMIVFGVRGKILRLLMSFSGLVFTLHHPLQAVANMCGACYQ